MSVQDTCTRLPTLTFAKDSALCRQSEYMRLFVAWGNEKPRALEVSWTDATIIHHRPKLCKQQLSRLFRQQRCPIGRHRLAFVGLGFFPHPAPYDSMD